MCGIAGTFNYRTHAPVAESTIRRMTGLMRHRGPDGEGYHVAGAVGLGHRRLSIIDLNERGRNPLFTSDNRFAIVYNGEVYNYIELRQDLERAGVRFRTETDTEVILELFAREGARCLRHLNGMFAFAIWDAVDRRLFLARDRAGIKPLYYAETEDGIVFASEAKALFVHPGVSCEADPAQIDTYLTFGYTPRARTVFKGVQKLLPGWSMSISDRGAEARPYWNVSFNPDRDRSAEQTTYELRELLRDAARVHMRSDVPVGVFLSGGLDSSATVALLANAGFEGIKTFSVAYREGDRYDETRYAKIVSDHFRTDHHVLYVDPAEFGAFVPEYVWHMDEPVTESAAISLYFISRLLRQHVTVALSGEGADELFAGYDIYRYMRWIETYRRLPPPLRTAVEPLAKLSGNRKLRKYAALAAKPLEERYLGVHLHEPIRHLYSGDFASFVQHTSDGNPLAPLYRSVAAHDPLTRMLYADFSTWLVDDLLIKADKMTMANSVELRVPFLDYRVIEYAATIPSHMKQRGGSVKWILKRAVEGLLPQEILQRKKVGFPTPLEQMFRGPLSEYVHDLLRSQRSLERGYFAPDAIRGLLDGHRNGAAGVHDTLWRLVVLEEWHRRFPDAWRATEATSPVGVRDMGDVECAGTATTTQAGPLLAN